MFDSDGNSSQNKVYHIQSGVSLLAVLEMPFAGMSVVVLYCHGVCLIVQSNGIAVLTSGTFCKGI